MFPSYEEVKQMDENYNFISVAAEIYADVVTPITLLRKLAKTDNNFYLLESVEDGIKQARYSFLGEYKTPKISRKPPFTGVLVGYFAYEMFYYAEPKLQMKSSGFPDL